MQTTARVVQVLVSVIFLQGHRCVPQELSIGNGCARDGSQKNILCPCTGQPQRYSDEAGNDISYTMASGGRSHQYLARGRPPSGTRTIVNSQHIRPHGTDCRYSCAWTVQSCMKNTPQNGASCERSANSSACVHACHRERLHLCVGTEQWQGQCR